MKKIANVVQHTHWDTEWYFTEEDSLIQLTYHMKELIKALEENVIEHFFLDGQTAILEDYINFHPEDKEKIKKLITNKKLFVGPFHAQLDCFISSGEAVINNLRLGMQIGNKLGGVSKIAYLPDSFGQSQDFPKIFNGFGIKDFIFRRGMGDEHNLPSDFYWKSNDGSEILVNVINCGYGFATAPFIEGTLTQDSGLDYDGKNIVSQINSLEKNSTIKNEFLLPIGNDQTPVIYNFKELLEKYNVTSSNYIFEETTFEKYMNKLREKGENLKIYEGEFLNPQYHRVHKSIGSARTDIKILQDKVERIMTYEVQPLMVMLDNIGLEYDYSLIDQIWNLLVRSQTHSSATNTDETNNLILNRTSRALNLAKALKIYLQRKIAITISEEEGKSPLVIFNTLPEERDLEMKLKVYTKSKDFKVTLNGEEIEYSFLESEKNYGGTIRKDKSLFLEEKYYYKTHIGVTLKDFSGFSYKTLYIHDGEEQILKQNKVESINKIENERYIIELIEGEISIYDKSNEKKYNNVLYIEESGDEGDNYDYSYPTEDLKIINNFKNSKIKKCYQSKHISELEIEGAILVPQNLEERERKSLNSLINYKLNIKLKQNSQVIEVKGEFDNDSINHRVRIVFKTDIASNVSYDGTQFGYIKRETHPEIMNIWKKEKWLEEPTPINPLLNHVSLVGEQDVVSIFTRGIKEYEIIGENKIDIALTVFRSVGYLGSSDLNRRPGRPSGIAEKLIESPLSQMIGKNKFEFGISFFEKYDGNKIAKEYIKYATDSSYYQNQKLDKVVFPISYFETNPLNCQISKNYNLFELLDSEATFGTLKKSNNQNEKAYILRIFNNENNDIQGGKLKININYKEIKYTNIFEDQDTSGEINIGKLKKGEIKNIKIIL